jgi:hypothetical protein
MKVCKIENCKNKYYGKGMCKHHYDVEYFQLHKIRIISNIENRRAKIPGYGRNKHLKSAYGITLVQYNEILETQNGVCKLCGRKEWKVINAKDGKPHNLAVDHCHNTNKIRGLLCAACNTAIGHLQSDPFLLRRAAEYVEKDGNIDLLI